MSDRKKSMLMTGQHLHKQANHKVNKLMRQLNAQQELGGRMTDADELHKRRMSTEAAGKPRLPPRVNQQRASAARVSSVEEGDERSFEA